MKNYENPNRPVTGQEAEFEVLKLPVKESAGPEVPGGLYQTLNEELAPVLHRPFLKVEKEGRDF